MRNMIAILVVALSIHQAGVLAEEVPVGSCLKCSISDFVAAVPPVNPWWNEPSRKATMPVEAVTAIPQSQQSRQRRHAGRTVAIGALIGAGAGFMTSGLTECPHGQFCGVYLGIGTGVGAGVGALIGFLVAGR
jgi:hypothetical protein